MVFLAVVRAITTSDSSEARCYCGQVWRWGKGIGDKEDLPDKEWAI